jgi:two-component system, sensor histidine kinase RegB
MMAPVLMPRFWIAWAGHEGMGLGLFIAKTLLQRSGASVTIENRTDIQTGATIRINWPRKAIEAGA